MGVRRFMPGLGLMLALAAGLELCVACPDPLCIGRLGWSLRLRGGHGSGGCSCGDKGDESEQGLFDVIRLDACCSMNTARG
jgi:hypothetical protein